MFMDKYTCLHDYVIKIFKKDDKILVLSKRGVWKSYIGELIFLPMVFILLHNLNAIAKPIFLLPKVLFSYHIECKANDGQKKQCLLEGSSILGKTEKVIYFNEEEDFQCDKYLSSQIFFKVTIKNIELYFFDPDPNGEFHYFSNACEVYSFLSKGKVISKQGSFSELFSSYLFIFSQSIIIILIFSVIYYSQVLLEFMKTFQYTIISTKIMTN